jgi:catechol 2,3-dioxygenase-like lactoylglutathione lyase family enzyme
MRRLPIFFLLATSLLAAQHSEVKRPRILGIAHVALYVSDLNKARAFYKDFLGFDEPFALKRDDGSERIVFIKINDQQYVELFAEAPRNDDRLNHVAIYTDDAAGMRDYLSSRGTKVPDKVNKGRTGNYNFTINDPDGHQLEIVQYESDSWTAQANGKFMPASHVSTHLMHAGFLVGSLEPALKFYRDILGFQEFWRGSASGDELSWVNMRVPDGDDYVEFMLYKDPPTLEQRGVKNHICLETPDIQKVVTNLESRLARKSYAREIRVQTGKNHKRQANLFDPDGTRIELMEPKTIDGKPVASSNAAAPR